MSGFICVCVSYIVYCISYTGFFGSEVFSLKSLLQKIFSQITHLDKKTRRKVWHGDTFVKLIFVTKQRNMKFIKIIHCQYTVCVYMFVCVSVSNVCSLLLMVAYLVVVVM